MFVAPPLVLEGARLQELTEWQRQENAAFRHEIAVAEGSALRSDNGYGDRREDWGAVGRYQMRAPGLREAGWLPEPPVGERAPALHQGTTGWMPAARDAGVNSTEGLLRSPVAQERALDDYLRAIEWRTVRAELWPRIGETVRIGTTSVEITAPGLVAAAHRVGTSGVRQVLAGQRADDLAGLVLKRLSDFGERDAQGNLRFPYVPLHPDTPRPPPARPRGTRR